MDLSRVAVACGALNNAQILFKLSVRLPVGTDVSSLNKQCRRLNGPPETVDVQAQSIS